ncbi:MAG: PaaI family thioesterase [Anaerolineales bacterium]|nr:PaaI family thioesterase [Anaerolineales bacterium]
MNAENPIYAAYLAAVYERLGAKIEQYRLPPPAFEAMQAEFVGLDLEQNSLSVRFPVLETEMNPYHIMQGGMIAAAIDNAIGPLSVLVAPANVTRRMEIVYSTPVQLETGWITVRARLVERAEPRLVFKAEVFNPHGQRLVRARAEHWILS